jgi:hypothetical protein
MKPVPRAAPARMAGESTAAPPASSFAGFEGRQSGKDRRRDHRQQPDHRRHERHATAEPRPDLVAE